MARSDLLTRESVMKTLKDLFDKYDKPFNPEGDIEQLGFNADVPQTINAMPAEYSVEGVVERLEECPSFNIPHRGYCINKDAAIGVVRQGWNLPKPKYPDPEAVSDELDQAILFMDHRSFCDECIGRDCKNCNRYKAKKNTLLSLHFYRQIQEIFKRIAYLKTQASHDELKYYAEFEDMLNDAMTVAMNNTRML